MKKFVLFFSLLLLAVAGSVNAQNRAGGSRPQGKVTYQDFHFVQGSNTIQLTGGAVLTCRKSGGDAFSDVVYTDAGGKTFQLVRTTREAGVAPQPSCKYPLPDACFATADKSIGMCICKPTDLSGGAYSVALLLPAANMARKQSSH
jgi:hypothetical protein